MKKIFLFLLPVFVVYIAITIYILDKKHFVCPIQYKFDICIRSDNMGDGFFGASRSGGRRLHQGIDLFAEVGAPVLAARSGIVTAATSSKGMGKYIIIKHSGGISTLYGHLSQIYVCKGQFVRQGGIIGAVGKTGNANFRDMQPHLHFETRKNSIPEDPLKYLP